MCLTKTERLVMIMSALRTAAPFTDGAQALFTLAEIMRCVEDTFSGIEEHPDPINAEPDGRMYPPHDRYEKARPAASIRSFRQTGHRTLVGDNGALRIELSTGRTEIDLAGQDGRTISQLLEEVEP